jgi:uncharacterized CHY-type Zn-finger protein
VRLEKWSIDTLALTPKQIGFCNIIDRMGMEQIYFEIENNCAQLQKDIKDHCKKHVVELYRGDYYACFVLKDKLQDFLFWNTLQDMANQGERIHGVVVTNVAQQIYEQTPHHLISIDDWQKYLR